MRMTVTNVTSKIRLKYDVHDMILTEDVCKKDSRKFFATCLALSLDDQGKGHDSFMNRSRSKSRSEQKC